jgi:hypothetical protein
MFTFSHGISSLPYMVNLIVHKALFQSALRKPHCACATPEFKALRTLLPGWGALQIWSERFALCEMRNAH